MRLAETQYDNSETGCCAPLDRERWDRQTHHWESLPFLADHVREVFHVPVDFGTVMKRDQQAIEAAEAWPEHPFWLTDEVSPWGAHLYTAVDRELPGARMAHLTGTFLSRAFEGPYRDMLHWVDEMQDWVRSQGLQTRHLYFYYATCPRCAKKLGRNEVVLVAQVEGPPPAVDQAR